MKKNIAILIACLIASSSALATEWDINKNHISIGAVDQQWTIDPKFTGTKYILDARFSINRKMIEEKSTEDCCPPLPPAERLIGVLDGHFQYGDSETEMEYVVLGLTPLAYQRNRDFKAKKFSTVRDTLEFGRVLYSVDDPLGVDYYTEVTLARAGRTWGYKLSDESPWWLKFGVKGSAGWAWASSILPGYQNIDNPFLGAFLHLSVGHTKWGQLYAEDRVVEGFLLRSPSSTSAKRPSTREARIRGGYFKRFKFGMTLNLFAEKRSFNIDVPTLPSLYNKARRVGGEIGYQF